MSIVHYSQTFWNCMLPSIAHVLSISRLSYEASLIQNNASENGSQLFQDSESPNHGSSWPGVYNGTTAATSSTPESGDGEFHRNNRTMAARDLQVCDPSSRCRDDLLTTPRLSNWHFNVTCFPCDCDNPLCEFYGTCCPGYYTPSVEPNIVADNAPQATSRQWHSSNVSDKSLHLMKGTTVDLFCDGPDKKERLSKRSCPSNYPDDDVKSNCQNDIPATEQDLDTFLHVVDNNTGHSYYNTYCSTCNNVQQLKPWTLAVACRDYMTVYTSRTPGELLRLSLAADSGCSTLQTPPDDLVSTCCDRAWFHRPVVDTCNVTGQWDEYDEYVVKACADVSGLVNLVRYCTQFHDVVYKNAFCAACNMRDHEEDSAHCELAHGTSKGYVYGHDLVFSVLLNFSSDETIASQRNNVTKCSEDSEWTSPDNKCLPLQCSPGKILTNGFCSTALNLIRGLFYQIHVQYVPTIPIVKSTHTESISDLHQTYLNLFNNIIAKAITTRGEFEISLNIVVSDHDTQIVTRQHPIEERVNTSRMFQINCFAIDGLIRADPSFSRDEFEASVVRELTLNNIILDGDTNTTLTLMPVLNPHRKHAQTNCSSADTETVPCLSPSLSYRYNWTNIHQAIIIEPHLNCAFLEFNKTEYLYESNVTTKLPSCSITLYFKEARMIFSASAELNMVSIDDVGTMRICYHLLKTKILIIDQFINESVFIIIFDIIIIMCYITSMVCLVIALTTYFLFQVLRNVAGYFNMFLCFNLLMAQLSLFLASFLTELGLLCTILAICRHFFWLSMFCWCFICCFHMFCVFSANTWSIPATPNSETAFMVKRIVACSVIPGLTVAGVITTSYAISGGQFIGYGNTSCFLDSQISRNVTMVAPLCLTLSFSVIFFSITVIKIYNLRKLQTRDFRSDARINLYVYIKLSSLTGIFWIFSLISSATNNYSLGFVANVLNGLQGVYIFVSYICTRRVFRLYQNLLGLEKRLAPTATSS